MSSRRRLLTATSCLIALLAFGGTVVAQMEAGERGILPIDSSGTLEVTGIHVDVGGKDAASARYAGWRIAQREGFKKLWAKQHSRPLSEAPNCPNSTLDGLVSSIIVERENIGPNRYIADLGILFDRARAGELLGFAGEVRRSAPMLLIPVLITGGTADQCRDPQPLAARLGAIPHLAEPGRLCPGQRHGGRPLAGECGPDPAARPRLVAQHHRPLRRRRHSDRRSVAAAPLSRRAGLARFVGRHGPDGEIIGGFDLKARDSADIPRMMAEGVRRMDELFTRALAAGELVRDPSLIIIEPPPLVEDELADIQTVAATVPLSGIQVQILTRDDAGLANVASALRSIAGVEGVGTLGGQSGWSLLMVNFRGDSATLASAMRARGWSVSDVGGTLRVVPGLPVPVPQPSPSPAGRPPATP